MIIKKSDKSNKKLQAIFTKDNGRTKTFWICWNAGLYNNKR